MDLTDDFYEMYYRINQLNKEDRPGFILDLGRDAILRYQALECEYRDTGLSVVYVSATGIALHSSSRPAIPPGGFYCLFNVEISQREWFHALGYTEEEQIMHRLQWG
jgi:hypothetical protein